MVIRFCTVGVGGGVDVGWFGGLGVVFCLLSSPSILPFLPSCSLSFLFPLFSSAPVSPFSLPLLSLPLPLPSPLQALEEDSTLEAVFLGRAPYTTEPFKKLAGAGSCFFDTLYFQVTAVYKLQTTKKHDMPAPNDALGALYDLIVTRASHMSEIGSQKSHLLSRHWNNKGNSMEALSLLMVERGDHTLIVVQAWLVMQLQFAKGPYPGISQWLSP